MPRKKKAKPATRGERVQMRLCDCRLVDVRENEDWAREAAVIERAMKRVEKRGMEEVLNKVHTHAALLRRNLVGCKDEKSVEHWRQCIRSFERIFEKAVGWF